MWIMKIAFILTLLAPLSAHAVEVADLINGQASNFDKNQRKQLAERLMELFESLDVSFPSPKPSEQKWIDEERQAIPKIANKDSMGKRLAALHESVEFQQENMKRYIKSIQDALACVMRAEDLSKEIYCWSLVSFFLTEKGEFDAGIAILLREKKLGDKGLAYFGGPHIGYGYFYNRFGRGIQQYFVIPYLANSLKK